LRNCAANRIAAAKKNRTKTRPRVSGPFGDELQMDRTASPTITAPYQPPFDWYEGSRQLVISHRTGSMANRIDAVARPTHSKLSRFCSMLRFCADGCADQRCKMCRICAATMLTQNLGLKLSYAVIQAPCSIRHYLGLEGDIRRNLRERLVF